MLRPKDKGPFKLGDFYSLNNFSRTNIMAVWDGKPKRCPKKGEWYLRGAIVEAYKAPNDLGMEFFIAELVKVKRKETVTYTKL